MKTIVLTGGGTAGHVMPNIALLNKLKTHFDKVVYIGGEGMEEEIAKQFGVEFYKTTTVKLDRSKIFTNLKIPVMLRKGIKEAKEVLKALCPDAVFSKGGYAALPACFAAKGLKIPVFIHESDFSLGLANKLCQRFAEKTFTSFPETKGGEFVGNPIREELLHGNAEKARTKYGLKAIPTVLIFGGSLGSKAINEVVYQSIDSLTKKYNVIHITGKSLEKIEKHGYVQIEFAYDIADLYALSDVLVIRGGANSLAEASALGKPTLSIPLPKGSSRGDQLLNAQSYQKRGHINLLLQHALTPETLIKEIEELFKKNKQKGTGNQAADKIVSSIINVSRGRRN